MNAKEILQSIINKFDVEEFNKFFRAKNDKLKYPAESIASILAGQSLFSDGRKLAEGKLDDGELGIYSFLVNKNLSERSGKKAQYELGKKILKEQQADTGIFIFYDPQGDFRYSLIYTNYLGKRRDWSNFRRFTYFVSPKLTNKTFLRQIGDADFSTLEKIKEAFSVEPVTKQFYGEIQSWYFWAMDKIKFPDDYKYSSDPAKDKEIRNATNLIRLITRIIFVWFLREKDLIPAKLFLKNELKTIVKGFKKDNNASNFYNAILQNLFFGTLNQKMNERKFAEDRGYPANKKEHGVKNLYRYADKFLISKNEVLELFKDIPFLNGGLFDCLDKENETGKVIYIDGFSRNPAKQSIIPDYLFFQQEEENVDLSQYGLGNKPVRGLIEILNSYNFTIDENTPIDQEIALDPELLGKVFENLLASYNPETATTARKATGSYYTPREIVDYMVEVSLSEYLKSSVSILANGNGSASILAKSSASILANEENTASIPADGSALEGFLNPYNEIQIYEGNLPHWQQKNVFYFVTFRLADSIPREKVEQLKRERELWLKNHPKDKKSAATLTNDEEGKYSIEELKEYYRLFSERVEKWLNEGAGSCILKEEKFAKIVAEALLYFNNQRYILDEWVIMPNHVHILVKPLGNHKLPDILHSWKSFTANEINKLLGIKGQLWMHESYDHIVRNEKALYAIRNYIRQNPIKAGLTLPDCAQSWTYSIRSITASDDKSKSKDALDTFEEKIKALLSYSETIPEFSEDEKQKLISAIDEIKILDPACGSGAFPMGVLHKLVSALQKLDPENKYWYELQYQKALKSVASIFAGERPESAVSIPADGSPESNDALGTSKNQREERLKEINETFDEGINYPDYARKLYLIENCIYGVDIQPIAIQISKLRFFISLVLDQKVDRNKENFGIRALPNLETRFVSANTLLGLDKPQNIFYTDKIRKLENEIKSLRHKYFQAKTRREKIDYQKKDNELRELLAKELKQIGYSFDSSEKIAKFDLYDQNASADFFDPEWMFGVKDGFDIIIGNPPYVRIYRDNIEEKFLKYIRKNYDSAFKKFDLYVIFMEKGINLLNKNGFISLIVPDKWLTQPYGKMVRNFILNNCNILLLLDLTAIKVFESSTVDNFVFLFKKELSEKQRKQNKIKIIKIDNISEINNLPTNGIREIEQSFIEKNIPFLINIGQKDEKELIKKIKNISINLYEICYVNWGCRPTPKEKFVSDNKINEKYKPLIVGSNISKYHISPNYRWVKYVKDMYNPMFKELFENITVVFKDIIGKGDLTAALNSLNYYSDFTVINAVKWKKVDSLGLRQIRVPHDYEKYDYYDEKFILGIVNSRLESFYFNKTMRSGLHTLPNNVKNLLLPIIAKADQESIISLVDKILAITKDDDYLQNPSKQAKVKEYERQIDQMVYKLYDLTDEEIKIVEGDK